MCWNGPIAPLLCWTNVAVRIITDEGNKSMQTVTTVGLDLAKSVFQVHGVDGEGVIVIKRALRRAQVLDYKIACNNGSDALSMMLVMFTPLR